MGGGVDKKVGRVGQGGIFISGTVLIELKCDFYVLNGTKN